MININDVVRSINSEGAIQIPGKVVALYEAQYFLKNCSGDPDQTWSKRFPNWKEKPVVLVQFETPQRIATLKEWIESGVQQGFDEAECRNEYEENCPVVTETAFPYDDLINV